MLLVLATAALAATSARAVVYTWNTFGNGNYNSASNWFPGGVPGANDFVSFEVGWGQTYTIYFPGNEFVINGGAGTANYSAGYLRVRDSGVTFSGSTQPMRGPSAFAVTSTTQTEANRGIIIGVGAGETPS